MLWSGAFGHYLNWNTDYYNSTLVSHGYGIIEHIADNHYFFDPSNPDDPRTNQWGQISRPTYGTTYNNRIQSDWNEYKGDYFKLKNIQIGYTLPQRISSKFFVNKLRAFVSMDNIPDDHQLSGTRSGNRNCYRLSVDASGSLLADRLPFNDVELKTESDMKKILMILTMALAATSCMDILDVAPEDQIASENMWTTEELADKGMAGLYFPFYATQLSSTQLRRADGLNRRGIEAMSFATDYYSNNYPVELLSLATKPANDFQVWYEWKFCYTIIHACNDAIANLHKADMSANKLARYQCEARFLRAWAYNRLNMLYRGVPVYLEPINNEDCTRTNLRWMRYGK